MNLRDAIHSAGGRISIGSAPPQDMMTWSATCGRRPGGAFSALSVLTLVAIACLMSAGAHANPAEHMFDNVVGSVGGGTDPHGNSWLSIQHSLEQFLHPEFILRLFLSLTLAVACAWVVAWHPRSTRFESLANLEERKTLVLLGMVGAIVAELSSVSSTLAFVIFGIGALLRFRTVLDNPKLTGKAITVVVIGLACGMGSWVMAILVTGFSWVLIFWLDSRIACRLRIWLARDVDPEPVFGAVQSLLVARRCRMQSSTLDKTKGQLVFLLHIPADLDLTQFRSELRATLPQADTARVEFNLV
jgi:hypothetical protein